MLSCNGIFYVVLVIKKNVVPLQCKKIARSGAVVARWAHNPKVVGSNPTPATKKDFKGSSESFLFRNTLQSALINYKIYLYRHRILILFQHNYPSKRLCSRQLDIYYRLTPTTQVRRVFNQPT